MNAEKEVGQLLMIGLAGTKLTAAERKFIRAVQPAGVIYFRRNISTPAQVRRLSRSVRTLYPRGRSPLIGIDQEGGRVYRLPPPFTLFPGNDYLGRIFRRTGHTKLAQAQALAQAQELKAVGINLNFTPVADINSNPRNPIIGSRAFGSRPTEVAKLVKATVTAYKKSRVISCAKHFPGHGDTFSDSHKKLPVVRVAKRRLLRRELVPFRTAISARVPTIMTSHVIYPAWDRSRPATLSPVILQDYLRKRLKFKGVCVSDDLEMAAIARHQSIPAASVRAIQAGVDLLLVCKSLTEAGAVFRRMCRAVDEGEISSARFNNATRHIKKLRRDYTVGKATSDLRRKLPARGWRAHQAIAVEIQELGK